MLEQFSNTIKRVKVIVVIMFLMCIVFIFMFRNIVDSEYQSDAISKNAVIYKNGEKVYTGDVEKYDLKKIKNEDCFLIEMNAAITQLNNPVIKFDNINTAYEVFVGNKKVYSEGMEVKKGGMVGHVMAFAPLGKVKVGQKIKVKMRVLDASVFKGIPKITMMNCNRGFINWYRETVIFQVIANISFILGCGIILYIYIRIDEKINICKNIGLVIISMGISLWIVACFQCSQVLYDKYEVDAIMEYASLYYIGIGLDLFVVGLDDKSKKRRIIDLIIMMTKVIALIVLTIMQLNYKMYFGDATWFLFLISIISIINFFIGYYGVYKNNKKKWNRVKYCCYLLVICIAVYIVLQAMVPDFSIVAIIIMPIALVAFSGTMFLEIILELVKGYSDSIENEALRELAYIDTLTGLPNRRAIIDYKQKIRNEANDYIIYSFDLNSLKKTNDMYGHSVGDQLLKDFSSELRKVFERNGDFCGRQGGDEFVAICIKEHKGKINDLRKNIMKCNDSKTKEYRIDYSFGRAYYNRKEKNIEEAMHEADENMYKMKFECYHNMAQG